MNGSELYDEHVRGVHRLDAGPLAEWERTYSLFLHLSLLAFHFVPIPVVPALVMWLIKRDESAFVDDHGREAMNFQISLVLYALCLVPVGMLTCGVGFALYVPLYALGIVGLVMGASAAHRGQYFRYPMTIRFIK